MYAKQKDTLKLFLDEQVDRFNNPSFIENDPISLPHRFDLLQDREIIGFWTAMLSWGHRKTILSKADELVQLMDNAPYDFIINHTESDRKRFLSFKHRTFQATDTLYFLTFLQFHYQKNHSLESALITDSQKSVKDNLISFHEYFFSLDAVPDRTKKHVSTPLRKSTCKKLNMFLRWMVRNDNKGVDFGCWRTISPSKLRIPYDVHVDRVARKLGLIQRKQKDWQTVEELTNNLSTLCPDDPVKYDFALFGLGVLQWDK